MIATDRRYIAAASVAEIDGIEPELLSLPAAPREPTTNKRTAQFSYTTPRDAIPAPLRYRTSTPPGQQVLASFANDRWADADVDDERVAAGRGLSDERWNWSGLTR